MHFLSTVIILTLGVSPINMESLTSPPKACNDVVKTNAGKLKKALFCGYDTSVRPVLHHSNQTFVKLSAFPTNIHWIMEQKNQMWMSFWIFMQWKDELLTWNSSDYEGLEELYVEASHIWVPDIFVSDPPQSYPMTKQMSCLVHSNGDVECTMSTSLTTRCNIDLTYFPFDRHSCKVVLRPRSYHGPVLNLDFMDTSGTDPLKFYRSHGAWNLMSVKFIRNVTNIKRDIYTTDMEYSYVIERRSSSYNVTYATPALVMMMMVLSVFWLEVQCSARIILPALAILGHLIIIEWLMEAIESNFDHLPVIILLFRDSLLMTGLALVWSVISRSLCTSSTSPYWLYIFSTNLNLLQFCCSETLLMTGLALVWSVISRSLCTSSTSPYWLYIFSTNLNLFSSAVPRLSADDRSSSSVECHLPLTLRVLNISLLALHCLYQPELVAVLLFRDSLLMTGLALVWSVISRSLCASSTSPYWLYIVSSNLNSNQVVKYLLPQDIFIKSGTSGDEDESSLVIHRDCVEQQWRILTTLTDRLLFGFSLLAYMYFYMRLTP